jgi:hypothetical protein
MHVIKIKCIPVVFAHFSSFLVLAFRFLETEKAFAMYDEMMEKKMPVDVNTFNELLRAAVFSQDTYETKWRQVGGVAVCSGQ